MGAEVNTTMTTASVVSARGLRKAYKNKLALDGTHFDIPAGRIIGLIGPNGAGKTTAGAAALDHGGAGHRVRCRCASTL